MYAACSWFQCENKDSRTQFRPLGRGFDTLTFVLSHIGVIR